MGGLATLSGVILQWRNRRLSDTASSAKIGVDEATQRKIVADAAHSVEQDYLQRMADFRIDIARLNKELDLERQRSREWRDRLTMWEDFFFTRHIPWDRKMTLVAREHDWTIEDPPSVLDYFKDVQDKIDAAHAHHDPSPPPSSPLNP